MNSQQPTPTHKQIQLTTNTQVDNSQYGNQMLKQQFPDPTSSQIHPSEMRYISDKKIIKFVVVIVFVFIGYLGYFYWTMALLNQSQIKTKEQLFNEYFDSVASVIRPSIPVKTEKEYIPINWPQFRNPVPITQLTSIFISSGRGKYLKKSLESFFIFNTYPIKRVIVFQDGKSYPQFEQLMKIYQNITWIISNIKVGQIVAVDQSLKYIDKQDQYYFISEDDWEYKASGFIQYTIQALEYDQKLNGLRLGYAYPEDYPFKIGPLNLITVFQQKQFAGFSFNPSSHRTRQYRLLDGGFSGVTYNLSYGRGAGSCQDLISMFYISKGYHSAGSNQVQFYTHIGASSSGNKFWLPKQVPGGINEIIYYYYIELQNHKQLKQQLDSLQYLQYKQSPINQQTTSYMQNPRLYQKIADLRIQNQNIKQRMRRSQQINRHITLILKRNEQKLILIFIIVLAIMTIILLILVRIIQKMKQNTSNKDQDENKDKSKVDNNRSKNKKKNIVLSTDHNVTSTDLKN